MAAGHHLRFGPTGSSIIRSADPEYSTVEPNMKWIRRSVERYGRSKFCMASRHLGFATTGSSAIRTADLENPT